MEVLPAVPLNDGGAVSQLAVLGEVGDVHVDARRYCLSCCDFPYCRSSSPCLISIISVPGPAGFAGVLLVSFMIIGNVREGINN